MRHIVGIDLTEVGTFSELSVDFTSPLTYVRGDNQDTKNKTGNGSGKTQLFSTLANMLHERTPLSLVRKSHKAILNQKNSKIGMIVQDGDDEWEIIQTGKKYLFYKNGDDQEVRTVAEARALIKKLVPITESEMYCTMYLTSQVQHPIQRVKDEQRLNNFVEFFRLDQHQLLQQHFSKLNQTVNDKKIELETLVQQQQSTTKRMEKEQCDVSPKDYKKSKGLLEDLDKTLGSLNKTHLESLSRQESLTHLLEVEEKLDKLRAEYPFKIPVDEAIEMLEAHKKLARAWQRHGDELKTYKKQKERLTTLFESLPEISESTKELKGKLDEVQEKIEGLSLKVAELSDLKERSEEVTSQRDQLLKKVGKFDKELIKRAKTFDLEDLISKKGAQEQTLSLERLIHKHVDGKCPTCNSDIDVAKIKKVVKAAKTSIEELDALIEIKKLLERGQSLKQITFDADALEAAEKKLSDLKVTRKKISKRLDTAKELKAYEKQLTELEYPVEPKQPNPGSLDDIEAQLSLCHKIEKALIAKAATLKSNPELKHLKGFKAVKKELNEINKELEQLEADKSALMRKKAKHSEIVRGYEQYKSALRVYENELVLIEDKIKKLKKVCKNKRIYEVLTKAYGAKGIRSVAVAQVCKLYEKNLNHYASYIFSEPFSFSVKASQKGVSLLVDRNNKRPNSVTDVRDLSGAESNQFALLNLAALLPLIPNDRRVNLVVLDEPTSHMDEASRRKFNDDFLPLLQEMVPNIFIITPNEDDVRDDASEWIVTKKKGISTLEVVQ